MEVGAVKQAFNNEVIQLKRNLNQAKIQVIHKLTRKAKTLAEKKAPDHLKEKLKKKAESAVQEVLIMKKLKPRDIARFIITHTGELNSHLNKPAVDNDKACARLLLHKSLQQKYKTIKEKFGNISIQDLLMSRQERRKLKKEAKEQQKNKKKGNTAKVVNSDGDWNVEDVEMKDDDKVSQEKSDVSDQDDVSNDESQDIDDEDIPIKQRQVVGDSSEDESGSENEEQLGPSDSDEENGGDNPTAETDTDEGENSDGSNKAPASGKFVKPLKETKLTTKTPNFLIPIHSEPKTSPKIAPKPHKQNNNSEKKVNDKKNKNLKEKLLNRKFKKETDDSQTEKKVVDPFFITTTGENYMSLAEPRQPDEVKDIHSQGNRKLRRSVMFGHVPNIKPRRDNFRQNNFKSGKYENINYNGMDSNSRFNKFDGNDRRNNDRTGNFSDRKFNNDRNSNFHDRNSKFNDRATNFNNRNSNFNESNSKTSYEQFSDRNSKFSNNRNFNNNGVTEAKEEKLHPSWEAKKKQSGILPFKGKKIVFD